MSEDFNKKTKDTQKSIDMLRKDIRFREQQAKRGQTTYQLDAEIKGSLQQLEQLIANLEKDVTTFKQNPKDYGISNKQVEKRVQQFDKLKIQCGSLKRANEAFFEKKPRAQDLFNRERDDQEKPKADLTKMNAQQLRDHKKKQQQEQEAAVDDLINTVKNIKTGGQQVHKELTQQDKLLNQLQQGMDDNTQEMGTVRRKMMKLMEESSYFCLIAILIIQIVAIVLLLVLWR